MILPRRITAQGLLLLTLLASPSSHAAPDDCAARRSSLDGALDAAGFVDPRHDRSRVSPWVRRDPFLAAELDSARARQDDDATAVIVRAMAALDTEALEREAGPETAQALERCRNRAVDALLANPAALQALAEEPVPDGYSDLQRLFGAYPLARPFLRAGAARWRSRERAAIARGAPPPTLVQAPAGEGLSPAEVARILAALRAGHPLAWPVADAAALARLGPAFAPEFATDRDAPEARIGRLSGRDGRPVVDTSEPVAYLDATLVRWGDHVLLQLAYTVWFTERPRSGLLDPYGGAVDGLVLRVTLGDDGRPLLWESIHPCGCYYTVFLPEDRPLRYDAPAGGLEAALALPGPAAQGRVRLQHTPGTHYARGLVGARPAGAARRVVYALRPYAELLARGPERPPFDRHGILAGTQRLERLFLWPSGIRSPGAMRSAGRQATAFLGRRRFERSELLGGRLRPAPARP